MTMKRQKLADDILTYLLLFVLCFFMSLPIISMLGTSLKTSQDALASYSLFPESGKWYFENFATVLTKTTFASNILNSAIVSVGAAVLCMVLSCLAGYTLSRYHTRITAAFTILLLALQMLPIILVLVPTFMIYRGFHLTDTLLGLVLNYTATNLAFSIWMLKGFFDTIPKELEEAAMMDGCTRFGAFLRVILPISAPGISTVAIFAFVRCWNEYMVARVLIQSDEYKTINLGLQQFVAQYSVDWALLSAAAVIATIPTIIFLVCAQKYLVQGLTAGAVKG
ncbi:MAG: carbohydrate ABC transporter permease [Gemmiger sp.]|nr:carbohydrate ABC transporter permease [Gemmiger sp.]